MAVVPRRVLICPLGVTADASAGVTGGAPSHATRVAVPVGARMPLPVSTAEFCTRGVQRHGDLTGMAGVGRCPSGERNT